MFFVYGSPPPLRLTDPVHSPDVDLYVDDPKSGCGLRDQSRREKLLTVCLSLDRCGGGLNGLTLCLD